MDCSAVIGYRKNVIMHFGYRRKYMSITYTIVNGELCKIKAEMIKI